VSQRRDPRELRGVTPLVDSGTIFELSHALYGWSSAGMGARRERDIPEHAVHAATSRRSPRSAGSTPMASWMGAVRHAYLERAEGLGDQIRSRCSHSLTNASCVRSSASAALPVVKYRVRSFFRVWLSSVGGSAAQDYPCVLGVQSDGLGMVGRARAH
jgi:hypothetical protein